MRHKAPRHAITPAPKPSGGAGLFLPSPHSPDPGVFLLRGDVRFRSGMSGGAARGRVLGTFPRGLFGVLRTRTLVRAVNLLASSVGSSCQLSLDSGSPSWEGLCNIMWEGVATLKSSSRPLPDPPPPFQLPGAKSAPPGSPLPLAPHLGAYRLQGHKHRAASSHQGHGLVTVEEGLDDDDLVPG